LERHFAKKLISKEERRKLQDKVDALKIIKGFPKVVWQYCTFTPEDYEKRKEKLKTKRGFCELFIPKLFMNEWGTRFEGLYGAYCAHGDCPFKIQEHVNILRSYRENENREAIMENGDIIKYREGECRKEQEWIFSPMVGWDRMPEEIIKQINDCNCMWDYYGNVIFDEIYADPEVGWRNQFFVMKSSGEWKFRIAPHYLIYQGFWKPFSPPKQKKKM
jgi:hypothetical protein